MAGAGPVHPEGRSASGGPAEATILERKRPRGSPRSAAEAGGENSRRSRFHRAGDRHRSISRSRRMGACHDGGARPEAAGSIKRGRRPRALSQARVTDAFARATAKERRDRPTRVPPASPRQGCRTGRKRVGRNRRGDPRLRRCAGQEGCADDAIAGVCRKPDRTRPRSLKPRPAGAPPRAARTPRGRGRARPEKMAGGGRSRRRRRIMRRGTGG